MQQPEQISEAEKNVDALVEMCLSIASKFAGSNYTISEVISIIRQDSTRYGSHIIIGDCMLMIQEILERVSAEDQSRLKNFVQECAESLITFGRVYVYNEFCKMLHMAPVNVLDCIRKIGLDTIGDHAGPDLCNLLIGGGNEEEVNYGLLRSEPIDVSRIRQHTDEFDSMNKRIVASHKIKQGTGWTLQMIDAIPGIRERQYDAVVGILTGGGHIPIVLRALGENAGAVEWHRSKPKLKPKWKLPLDPARTAKGQHILLCENDASSGITVRRIVDEMKEVLSPQSLSICFTGSGINHSKQMAKHIGAFNDIFHVHELPHYQMLTNLLETNKQLKTVLESMEK